MPIVEQQKGPVNADTFCYIKRQDLNPESVQSRSTLHIPGTGNPPFRFEQLQLHLRRREIEEVQSAYRVQGAFGMSVRTCPVRRQWRDIAARQWHARGRNGFEDSAPLRQTLSCRVAIDPPLLSFHGRRSSRAASDCAG